MDKRLDLTERFSAAGYPSYRRYIMVGGKFNILTGVLLVGYILCLWMRKHVMNLS
jgi:hypothetical protein